MLRQNEAGVLSGSEFFFNTIDSHISNLFYYTSLCGHYYCDDQYIIDRQYYDFHLDSLSTLRGKAMPVEAVIDDREGTLRGDTLDIGCFRIR